MRHLKGKQKKTFWGDNASFEGRPYSDPPQVFLRNAWGLGRSPSFFFLWGCFFSLSSDYLCSSATAVLASFSFFPQFCNFLFKLTNLYVDAIVFFSIQRTTQEKMQQKESFLKKKHKVTCINVLFETHLIFNLSDLREVKLKFSKKQTNTKKEYF
jgi:hypothetical protein